MFLPGSLGKYRSDLCRLAQLYRRGGVYLDNDIEILVPLGPIVQESHLTSVLEPTRTGVFQALLAAPARSCIIAAAINSMTNIIVTGQRSADGGSVWLGPSVMAGVLRRQAPAFPDSTRLARQGIRLLQEVVLDGSHPLMSARAPDERLLCNIALIDPLAASGSSTGSRHPASLVGFSRMVPFLSASAASSSTCHTRHAPRATATRPRRSLAAACR